MSNDTKFRQLGELIGRCNYEEGESPQNKFDNGDDPQPQPDGTRFISFGEDVLSASANRGLVALAANTDLLHVLGKQYSPKIVQVAALYDAAWAGQTKFNVATLVARVWPKKVTGNADSAANTSITDADVDFIDLGVMNGDRVIFDPETANEEIVTVTGVAQHVLTTTLIANAAHKGTPPASPGYAVLTLPWVHLDDGSDNSGTVPFEHNLTLRDSSGRLLVESSSGDLLQFNGYLIDGLVGATSSDVLLTGTIKDDGIHRHYVEIESGDFNSRNIQPGCWVELTNVKPSPDWDHLNGFYPALRADGAKVYLGPRIGATLPTESMLQEYVRLYGDLETPAPLISYPAEEPPTMLPGDVRGTVNVYPGWFYPLGNDQFDLWASMSRAIPSDTECPQFGDGLQLFLTAMCPAAMPRSSGEVAFEDLQNLRGQWEVNLNLQSAYNGLREANDLRSSGRVIDASDYGPVEITGDPERSATTESQYPTLFLVNNQASTSGYTALLVDDASLGDGSSTSRAMAALRLFAMGSYSAVGDLITLADTTQLFTYARGVIGGDTSGPATLVTLASSGGALVGTYLVHQRTAAGAASTLALRGLDGSTPVLAADTYTVKGFEPIFEIGPMSKNSVALPNGHVVAVVEPADARWRSAKTATTLLHAQHCRGRWDGANDGDAAAVASLRVEASGAFGPGSMYLEGVEVYPQRFQVRQNLSKSKIAADDADRYATVSFINDAAYTSPYPDDTPNRGVIELAAGEDLRMHVGDGFIRAQASEGLLLAGLTPTEATSVRVHRGLAQHGLAVGAGYFAMQLALGRIGDADVPLAASFGTGVAQQTTGVYGGTSATPPGGMTAGCLDIPSASAVQFVVWSPLISLFRRPALPQITLYSGAAGILLSLVGIDYPDPATDGVYSAIPPTGVDEFFLTGLTVNNTDDGCLYYEVLDTGGGGRTINLYSDRGKTALVAHLSVVNTPAAGDLPLVEDNGSGVGGTLHFDGTDVDAETFDPDVRFFSMNYFTVTVYNHDAGTAAQDWYASVYLPAVRDMVGLPPAT